MRMGDKILPISVLLAIPAVLLASFPFEALSFRAGDPSKRSSSFTAAVVSLDSAVESAAIRAAKSSWRQGGPRKVRVDLLPSELPEASRGPMAPLTMRSRPPTPPLAEGAISPFLPSRRASAPARIATAESGEELPFSREELLKID